jgi:hypothetical protein
MDQVTRDKRGCRLGCCVLQLQVPTGSCSTVAAPSSCPVARLWNPVAALIAGFQHHAASTGAQAPQAVSTPYSLHDRQQNGGQLRSACLCCSARVWRLHSSCFEGLLAGRQAAKPIHSAQAPASPAAAVQACGGCSGAALQLLHLRGQLRDGGEEVLHQPVVRHLRGVACAPPPSCALATPPTAVHACMPTHHLCHACKPTHPPYSLQAPHTHATALARNHDLTTTELRLKCTHTRPSLRASIQYDSPTTCACARSPTQPPRIRMAACWGWGWGSIDLHQACNR